MGKVFERAKVLAAKSGTREIKFSVAITAARVRAAIGKPAEAIRTLDATLAEAMKCGFVKQQYEARLALGEIEMKSGASAAGRTRLVKLQKDAAAKGFLLIARKATAAAAIR